MCRNNIKLQLERERAACENETQRDLAEALFWELTLCFPPLILHLFLKKKTKKNLASHLRMIGFTCAQPAV